MSMSININININSNGTNHAHAHAPRSNAQQIGNSHNTDTWPSLQCCQTHKTPWLCLAKRFSGSVDSAVQRWGPWPVEPIPCVHGNAVWGTVHYRSNTNEWKQWRRCVRTFMQPTQHQKQDSAMCLHACPMLETEGERLGLPVASCWLCQTSRWWAALHKPQTLAEVWWSSSWCWQCLALGSCSRQTAWLARLVCPACLWSRWWCGHHRGWTQSLAPAWQCFHNNWWWHYRVLKEQQKGHCHSVSWRGRLWVAAASAKHASMCWVLSVQLRLQRQQGGTDDWCDDVQELVTQAQDTHEHDSYFADADMNPVLHLLTLPMTLPSDGLTGGPTTLT